MVRREARFFFLSTWVYSWFVERELDKLVGDEEVEVKTLERMVKFGLLYAFREIQDCAIR